MRTAIRIEHLNGKGPFQIVDDYDPFSLIPEFLSRHASFPTADRDGVNRTQDHYFAYKKVAQIYKWVSKEEYKILKENNFRIYSLRLKNYEEGQQQIIFKKEDVINKKDITNDIEKKLISIND